MEAWLNGASRDARLNGWMAGDGPVVSSNEVSFSSCRSFLKQKGRVAAQADLH